MRDDWQEVEGALVTWNEPKELRGEYRGFTTQPSKFKPGETENKHTVFSEDGETLSFFAPAMLARMLESVVVGTHIKIVLTPETRPSKFGQPSKVFKLFVRKPEVEAS